MAISAEFDSAVLCTAGGALSELDGSHAVCGSCRTRYPSDLFQACPYCQAAGHADSDYEPIGMDLSFSIVRCDQGHVFPLGTHTECPECGEVLDIVDEKLQRRIASFGPIIDILKMRLTAAIEYEFADTGVREEIREFPRWISRAVFGTALGWGSRLTAQMSAGQWSDPESDETQAAWSQLQALMNDAIDLIYELKEKLPPSLLVAYHRTATRAVEHFAEACVSFMSALVVPSIEAAHELQATAQKSLDTSGETASRSGDLLDPVSAAVGERHDLAAASLALASRDLAAADALAMKVYTELEDISRSDPAVLRPLHAILLPVAAMHDHERRAKRFQAAYSVVRKIAPPGAASVDTRALGAHLARSRTELLEQYARLSAELVVGQPGSPSRAHTVLDVCSKFSEGPLRRVGSITSVIAGAPNQSPVLLDSATIERTAPPAKVLQSLISIDPTLGSGIDMLNRNAEAHYDYEIQGDVVVIRHSFRGQVTKKTATVDDIVVETANLGEVAIALLLALVKTGWEFGDVRERETFRRAWLRH